MNAALHNVAHASTNGCAEQELTRGCYAVCTVCGRGDKVQTETEQGSPTTTVKEHICTRCDAVGHTVISGRLPDEVFKTNGKVRTLDLSLDENEEYRGTF